MPISTQELLKMLTEREKLVSQKLLTDFVRRGLLWPPTRAGLKTGSRGSGSYWDDRAIERITTILRLRAEGLTYDEIASRLVDRPHSAKKRLGLTVWMPDFVAQRLEEIAKVSREPIVRLMQLGARLYHEAPSPFQGLDQDSMQLSLLAAGGIYDLPESERIFALWARFATRYWEVVDLLQQGKLPEGKESYLFWRVIQDGMVAVAMLEGFGVRREEIKQGEHILAELTIFTTTVRLLKPMGETAQDLELCRRLATEHRAVLVTAEGKDFNHPAAAQALGRVGDWLREQGDKKRGS